MYNVVIDTNVLVSGLISSNGNPAKIVNLLMSNRINILYNAEIIAEYEDVLNRQCFGFDKYDINELLDVITEIGVPVLVNKSTFPFKDEDDRVFYDVAVAGNSYLITGNTDHFPKESFIIKPKDFINMLENVN